MARKGERVSANEDDDEDIYDPKSKGFCRACVDLSKFGLLKAKEMVSKPSIGLSFPITFLYLILYCSLCFEMQKLAHKILCRMNMRV
ncbi:hypothetical protein Smp_103380 [Schistosoma mansoni]|uniref:hypothetical protein n=1 Tax=Schistosoma mansoni TaxID=6183 RepID=UPI00019B37AB|nr:hypothetical protein Smp_103380 [Schistosoma mansoni]|eukprot:XP_018652842.1 hypothetical protein Smp_103380 [Schistosoma mansoni]